MQNQWDHEQNAHLGSIVIKPYSHHKVHWSCSNCPDGHSHRWKAAVYSRTRNTGCPYCSGHAVCPHNTLARKAPEIAKEWDTAENPDSPHDYPSSSAHHAHWICSQGHQWQASINNRFHRKHGCPTCVTLRGRQKQPVLTASSSHIMHFWDWEKNARAGLDPHKLTCGSNRVAHFKCNKCPYLQPHQWTALIFSVVNGSGCPYCSGHQVCKCNSLQTLRPELAAEWCHAKNPGTPDDYSACASAVVWWESDKRGIFRDSIHNRYYRVPIPQALTTHPLL